MSTETMATLGERLKELRQRKLRANGKPWTQQDLAVAAGLSIFTVIKMESGGIIDPSWSTIRALAKALGVSTDELAPTEETEADTPKKPQGRRPKSRGDS